MGSRFLTYREADRLPDYSAVVYAFPLDLKEVQDRIARRVVTYNGIRPFTETRLQIEERCALVYPAKKLRLVVVHCNKGKDHSFALSTVICTKPNDEFIPSPEDLQKLKEILESEGFSNLKKPRWYWMCPT